MAAKLGDILVASGVVGRDVLDRALADQAAGAPDRIGEVLIANRAITPAQLAMALSLQSELPFTPLSEVDERVARSIPREILERHKCVPFATRSEPQGDVVAVAVANPNDFDAPGVLEKHLGMRTVELWVAPQDVIEAAIRRLTSRSGSETERISPLVPLLENADTLKTLAAIPDEAYGPRGRPVDDLPTTRHSPPVSVVGKLNLKRVEAPRPVVTPPLPPALMPGAVTQPNWPSWVHRSGAGARDTWDWLRQFRFPWDPAASAASGQSLAQRVSQLPAGEAREVLSRMMGELTHSRALTLQMVERVLDGGVSSR